MDAKLFFIHYIYMPVGTYVKSENMSQWKQRDTTGTGRVHSAAVHGGPPFWCLLPLEAVIGTASNLVLNVGVGRERGPCPWVEKERRVEEKIRKAPTLVG